MQENYVLRIAAPGLDDRLKRTLRLFFQGPCRNSVTLVEEGSADAAIIDMDAEGAEALLTDHQSAHPERVVILLSLQQQQRGGHIWLRKPVQIQDMMRAIDDARSRLNTLPTASRKEAEPPPQRKVVVNELHARRSKHQTAMLLDERGFDSFLGKLPEVDPFDPQQRGKLFYDPKLYLQGYIQAAYKLALSQDRILRVNTHIQPVVVFPHSREIWIALGDEEIRPHSAVPVNSRGAAQITVSPLSLDEVRRQNPDLDRFQGMEAFLWKLALWASSGRAPEGIELDKPVYLRRWPNLTRFVVPPHGLRIAALLAEQPRSLLSVAETLNINHAYVFAFFSAAAALGLAGQAKRQSDFAAARAAASAPPPKRKGLLTKILGYLRRQ